MPEKTKVKSNKEKRFNAPAKFVAQPSEQRRRDHLSQTEQHNCEAKELLSEWWIELNFAQKHM